MMENNSTPSLLGNRYQIQHQIGSGGMSFVFQARDNMLERTVAIKILRKDFSEDPAFRASFKQEAQSAANLSHPNIVTVHDFGLDSQHLFIVMEFVPGTTLKDLIKQRIRFSIQESLDLIIQACNGIGYAHRAGIVHCDVKPLNMLVTPDQRLKVTDFGIARALATIRPEEQHDIVWGSPQYFSPEQASGSAPSPASDVYSLGVILYEMLAGFLPFRSNDPAELTRLHRDSQPVPIDKVNPEIPPELTLIIKKVLSKEPSVRYRTADQFGRILNSFLQNFLINKNNNTIHGLPVTQTISSHPENIGDIPATRIQPPGYTAVNRSSNKTETDFYSQNLDWATVFLGLMAILAIGGLIPFWLYIYFSVFNP